MYILVAVKIEVFFFFFFFWCMLPLFGSSLALILNLWTFHKLSQNVICMVWFQNAILSWRISVAFLCMNFSTQVFCSTESQKLLIHFNTGRQQCNQCSPDFARGCYSQFWICGHANTISLKLFYSPLLWFTFLFLNFGLLREILWVLLDYYVAAGTGGVDTWRAPPIDFNYIFCWS